MIPVKFKVLVQHGLENRKRWMEFSKEGLLPAVPSIGTIIFIRKSNVNFLVNKIYMIDISDQDPAGEVVLIQIIPYCSEEILEAMREVSYKYENGWREDDLADNSRAVFIEGRY